jgi:Flp pilus assembly protein TadG
LLLVVLGIVDFGFLFQRMEVVTNAAREAARVRVLPGYADSDAKARACNYLLAGGVPITGSCPDPTNPTIVVNASYSIDLGAGTTPVSGVQVVVTYTSRYLFLTPLLSWFGGSISSVPIHGVAVMRTETPSS